MEPQMCRLQAASSPLLQARCQRQKAGHLPELPCPAPKASVRSPLLSWYVEVLAHLEGSLRISVSLGTSPTVGCIDIRFPLRLGVLDGVNYMYLLGSK